MEMQYLLDMLFLNFVSRQMINQADGDNYWTIMFNFILSYFFFLPAHDEHALENWSQVSKYNKNIL